MHLLFFRGTIPLNGKRGDKIVTSSIKENFYYDGEKAANTFVDLLLSEKPPTKLVVPVPTNGSRIPQQARDREFRQARCPCTS